MANVGRNGSYDVFLSFRGIDTRETFTSSLYRALTLKGVKTFMDDPKLRDGDEIEQALINAIRESRLSIVVFSERYANSRWCLNELVEIVECMRSKKQLVWPIFYKVEPSEVRHQKGSYGEAMKAHEERYGVGSHKVQNWKSALSQVADLKGRKYDTGVIEYEFIEEYVKEVTARLQCHEQLDVGEHVVGHESRIQELKSLLEMEKTYETVCMLGIYGTGGMGKTTLAKCLYNSIAQQFQYTIFLENVRERSKSHADLIDLQETFLSKLYGRENVKLGGVSEGISKLKSIVQHKKVLLVLDDVDSTDQLEKLAAGKCDWFGLGSRIIVTTRDTHVLDAHRVEKRYEMRGLNDEEALQLFCWKAFKMSQPTIDYKHVSDSAIIYANGLPLALTVIGSLLATKSVEECECALQQYKRIPQRNIHDILKISYDCLEENTKKVFLDIACFFKGDRLEHVEKVMERCDDFLPCYNIGLLVEKSLLAIKDNGSLWMHDLIQDMGREIVRQEAPSNPGQRSRLFLYQDVLKVLRENSKLEHLSYLKFSRCQSMTCLPDMSGVPNLRELRLEDCKNLISVHQSVGFLKKLVTLYVSHCPMLKEFPEKIWLPSLENLDLIDTNLEFFPHIEEKMYRPLAITVKNCPIKELPNSFTNLVGLDVINLDCPLLGFSGLLPSDLLTLPAVVSLNDIPLVGVWFRWLLYNNHVTARNFSSIIFLHCGRCDLTDDSLQVILRCCPILEELYVPFNDFVSLPKSITKCDSLRILDVSYCYDLRDIPKLHGSIQEIHTNNNWRLCLKTYNMLWSQTKEEVYKLNVTMPKLSMIPSWFDHRVKGGSLSFWARRKFPAIAVAFIFKTADSKKNSIRLKINGRDVSPFLEACYIRKSHVLLFDLRRFESDDMQPILDSYLVPDKWNHLEVDCFDRGGKRLIISHCGAYVYRGETDLEDIRFTCPHSFKRKSSSILEGSLPKRKCIVRRSLVFGLRGWRHREKQKKKKGKNGRGNTSAEFKSTSIYADHGLGH
ncbi:hypothetical protein PIB30_045396 [Stylosanthes scabra]|uniref:TIR domain-containing protein n=1 Tax=Stylosanthes scabra TaxID=79078 RepID=A0ABU6WIV4_9FABA|nr:hypothetical protein [Stylosanthes scabra]